MSKQPECCRKLVEAGWRFHWCGDGVSFVAAEHPLGGKQSVVEVLRVGRNGFDRNEIGEAITGLMNGDSSQPITPDWLDRCGVPKSTRGSAIVIYQAGVVGIRFVDGELRRVQFAGYNCDVETRQDLRDLLRLMGEPALVEP